MNTTFLRKEYEVKWWEGETLPSKFIALDTETEVVSSYNIPKMVTMQVYCGNDIVYYIPMEKVKAFLEMHMDKDIICHNAAFDIRVLEEHTNISFLEKYKKSGIWDTAIMYKLLHLALVGEVPFKYNLALLSEKFLGVKLDKDNDIRMEYSQYLGKEKDIPVEFLEYGARDVIATYLLFQHFKFEISKTQSSTWLSHGIQVGADYVLKRIHENGIGFDLARRDNWLEEKEKEMEKLSKKLYIHGWMRGEVGIRDTFYRILKRYGVYDFLPETETGLKSTSYDDLVKFQHIEFIRLYLKYIETEKQMTFVKDINTSRIFPRYNVLVNTGRVSCSKPNIQQIPREGGIREMFIPAKNNVFIDVDYTALELCSLAQVTYKQFGSSVMRDLINSGVDLHKYAAAEIYNKRIEDVTKKERQLAKILNFGLGANMGSETFVEYAAGYGVTLTSDESAELKSKWKELYPEMTDFWYVPGFKRSEINPDPRQTHMTTTGRIRGACTYTAFLNTSFQGLAADGGKLALFYLQEAGYKIVCYVHDQVLVEVHKDVAHIELPKIQKIMVDSMSKVIPDVKISTEGQILERWTK